MAPVPIPPPTSSLPTPQLTSRSIPATIVSAMRSQWMSPNDVLSILMVVGGDIVQRVVAQLAGTRIGPLPCAPVAFSFGWVAYSVSALTAALGDGRLLPIPEGESVYINADSGHKRENRSWVLSRLLRDEEHALAREHSRQHGTPLKGLTIAFYRTETEGKMGEPKRDIVYWTGVATIVAQLAIATVPWVISRNFFVFLVTAFGNLLTVGWTALPQLRREKYAARPVEEGKRNVGCLTKGNGSSVVIVFITKNGLRLEDLAGGRVEPCHLTLVAAIVSCVFWILLLLTVEGLEGDAAWFLFAIGSLGMVQNVYASGARRTTNAHGFNLRVDKEHTYHKKVIEALKAAEAKEPGVGLALLPVFFPGGLRPDEETWKHQAREILNRIKEETKAKKGLPPQIPQPPAKSHDRFSGEMSISGLTDEKNRSLTPGSGHSSDRLLTPSPVNGASSSGSSTTSHKARRDSPEQGSQDDLELVQMAAPSGTHPTAVTAGIQGFPSG